VNSVNGELHDKQQVLALDNTPVLAPVARGSTVRGFNFQVLVVPLITAALLLVVPTGRWSRAKEKKKWFTDAHRKEVEVSKLSDL